MKKAILVVSFGTSYIDTLKVTIEKAENQIRDYFNDYDTYRAFTSHKIIKKLKEKYEMFIDTPEEMLEKLYEQGYDEVIMQPLHIIPGEEFSYIKNIEVYFKDKFKSIKVGRPIFYYQGIEGLPEDYSLFIKSIKGIIEGEEAVVMMGHGTVHPSNAVYGALQSVLNDEGYKNVFVGTVKGYPNFTSVLNKIKKRGIKKVLLMPLMLVAGNHAINDMTSEKDNSWKSMLEAEGIEVKLWTKGLGEVDEFAQLYIDRVDDLINNRYIETGEIKKHKIIYIDK